MQRPSLGTTIVARIAGVLLLCLCATSVAAQSCQVPGGLLSLARSLSAVMQGTGPVTAGQAARLDAQLSQLSERRILSDLEEAGLQGVAGLAVDIMAEADRLSTAGTSFDANRLASMLSEFDSLSTLSCDSIDQGLFQRIQQERLGGIFTEEGVDWQEVERTIEEEKVTSLLVLITAVSVVIGTLYLIDTTVRWVMALVYNRKVCRIPANLRAHTRSVEGLVVTLGRGGFRFHALDPIAFDEITDHLELVTAELTVEGFDPLLCTMSRLHDIEADFRLETGLTIRGQRALLEHSTISPFYVKRSRDGGEEVTKSVV